MGYKNVVIATEFKKKASYDQSLQSVQIIC